jgi:hypothetical protein
MKRDLTSGILPIAGAATGMLVMGMHPAAQTLLEPGSFPRRATSCRARC